MNCFSAPAFKGRILAFDNRSNSAVRSAHLCEARKIICSTAVDFDWVKVFVDDQYRELKLINEISDISTARKHLRVVLTSMANSVTDSVARTSRNNSSAPRALNGIFLSRVELRMD